MKRLLILCAVALTLGGCGNAPDIIRAATSTIANPVKEVNIVQVKNGYDAVLEIAVGYRDYCWSKSFAALMADPIAQADLRTPPQHHARHRQGG
jgi:hypothetical protein